MQIYMRPSMPADADALVVSMLQRIQDGRFSREAFEEDPPKDYLSQRDLIMKAMMSWA